MKNGVYYIQGITVQNCGGSNGGGALATQSNLYFTDTRWFNNNATNGGAIGLNHAQLYLYGINQFSNNSATGSGGAIWLKNSAVILHGEEKFSGNSVGGSTSAAGANIYAVPSTLCLVVVPPLGTPPPLTSANVSALPLVYVDGSVDCGVVVCDGSSANPYNQLQSALDETLHFGGQIYVKPGIYSGNGNVNLTVNNHEVVLVSPWPSTVGSVVFDCMNLHYGFIVTNSYLNFADVTIQNCTTTSMEGGGAIYSNNSDLVLTNVNFNSNSAPRGSGGAIYLYNSAVEILAGSFTDNTNGFGGGAVNVLVSTLSITNGTIFVDNVRTENTVVVADDLECIESSLDSDGSINFQLGQGGLDSCSDSFSSKNTLAVFPGSLDTLLFPKNRTSGDIQSNVFAGLEFDSIVELDTSGTPIESTRITKAQLTWDVEVDNNTMGQWQVQYDAFGPAVQFLRIIHTFFYLNGTFLPFGGGGGGTGGGGTGSALYVEEGTIKTTIELALWPFLSPSNSLLLTLTADANMAVTSFAEDNVSTIANGTSFTIKTALTTITFGTLDYGVYDGLTKVGPVMVTPTLVSTGVNFGFRFAAFDLWAAYDPQFGVILGGTGGGDGSSGGGSFGDGSGSSLGLILGLSLGLGLSAMGVVVIVVLGVTGVSAYVTRQRWLSHRVATAEMAHF